MFPQQQTVVGIEDANVEFVPLHSDQASDPARGQAVIGGLDFDTTVEMHDPLAVLVVAKRFQGAVGARKVSLQQTWWRLAVWWCRGCGYRRSWFPNGPDRLALLPGSRSVFP